MPKWIAQSMLTHTENGPCIPPFGAEWPPVSLDERQHPLAEDLSAAVQRVTGIKAHIQGGSSHVPPNWHYIFRLRQARGARVIMLLD